VTAWKQSEPGWAT